jgi:hypothetical protein
MTPNSDSVDCPADDLTSADESDAERED